MALYLIRCAACNTEVSNAAAYCPHCGHPINPPKRARTPIGCGTVIAFVFLLCVLVGVISVISKSDDSPATPAVSSGQPESDDQMGAFACNAAIAAVKKKLLAPASSEFPNCVFGAANYTIKSSEDRREIIVLGYVDSQNAFGAKLRKKFAVKLARTGEGTSTNDFTVSQVEVE